MFESREFVYGFGMPEFELVAPFQPTGDQPQAIEKLADGLARGLRHQTLLGATGSGKTFTIASVIARHQRPTLVLAHNKTLAAQLYSEFRDFFPNNAVEYFVSYFDYYQPEAYLPRSDTYIEKDSSRNEEIDKLRHAATKALFERRDVIIVASVSCIYGLGAPVDYGATVLRLKVGGRYRRDAVLRHLVDLQYQRNDQALQRSRFRVRGDTLEIVPSSEDRLMRVEFFGDEIERITELDAHEPVLGRRHQLQRVAPDAEARALERLVVALVLEVHEVPEDGVPPVLPARPEPQHGRPVVDRRSQAVDAAHRRDDDHVAPLEQCLRRGVAELVDLLVQARVILDVRVGAREIGLRLVVVEVAHEVFDRVVREKVAELAVV